MSKKITAEQFETPSGRGVIDLSVDPTAGGGVAASIGTIGLRDNAGTGEEWLKTGATNTAWTLQGAGVGVHALGGAEHTADSLANLNLKVTDATLDDQDDPRPADEIIETGGPTTLVVGVVADGQVLTRSGATVVGTTPTSSDELVKVSADDTTAGRLEAKIVAGTGISLATLNPAGNEQLEITATGGGSVAAAQGDYICVVLSADQVNPAINDAIAFDTVEQSRGLSVVSNQFVLNAGRTYFLIATVRLANTSPTGFLNYHWYDVTNGVALGLDANAISLNQTATGSSTPTAHTIFTPTVDTTVEVRCSNLTAGVDIDSTVATRATIVEIGAVQANVIGGLEYMDRIVVGAATNSVVFGTGGDGVIGRALDGDVDGTYLLKWYTVHTADDDICLRPNGATTNQTSQRSTLESSRATFADRLVLCEGGAGMPWYEEGHCYFDARKSVGGVTRKRTYHSLSYSNLGTGIYSRSCSGEWDETATNITSLEIATFAGNNYIGAGSYFELYRLTNNNVRADSASTYERQVTAAVAQGTAAEVEYTTGGATFQGSAIGLSVKLNDTVTAGTITVNLKVAGSTVLTATLDTTNTSFHRAIESVGVHGVAPGDEIVVGIATSSLTTTGGATPGILCNVSLVNDALVRQTPAVVAQTVLSSPASTISVSGLNGDIDEEYEIEFNYIATGTAAHDVDIRPNGTTGTDRYTKRRSGGSTWTSTTGILLANGPVSTVIHHRSTFRCYVKRSVYQRRFVMNAVMTYSSTIVGDWDSWTTYSDGAANLTSLEFGITNVQFDAGSEIIVRRVVK